MMRSQQSDMLPGGGISKFQSKFQGSHIGLRNKNASKLSMYETNMQNFSKGNKKIQIDKIDPRGVEAAGIYGSFSGVIEDAQLYSTCDETLQISYKIHLGSQWHDETPQTTDTQGQSHFCESKGGQIAFSLNFDFLASCMYIVTWPKLVLKVNGFNKFGELVVKGYAQLILPMQTGQFMRKAYIYSIIRQQVPWYSRWNPFAQPQIAALDSKEIQRVIINGQGRQAQKIKVLGFVNIRVETLLRNFQRFGYK